MRIAITVPPTAVPRSGNRQEFPEVDRAEWFGLEQAREKILPAQAELLDRLLERLGGAEA